MQTSNSRRQDFLASIVVFLVALPLCMGISIACGVPPALGLVTGIVGGIIVGSIAGAPLQVSGPAAGLTVLVYELVQTHGLGALGVVVLAAGAIQFTAGMLKLGRWFRAVSPAVIHGMLAGIGILIVASQFHVMLDFAPPGPGLPDLVRMIPALWQAVTGPHIWALVLGCITLVVLYGWKFTGFDKKLHMPGHLPAIAIATVVAAIFSLPVTYVTVPENLLTVFNFPTWDSLGSLIEHKALLTAVAMALIASAETLLSANAVDQIQQYFRTDYNKELRAQGLGNILCGALGALPLTGVIARSTVNVEAGGRTRLSTILHGVWLLLAVVALPFVLKLIPVASLAALLIYTGIKLVDLGVLRQLRIYGRTEVGIYAITVGTIVATDLLTGVLVGMALSLAKLVITISQMEVQLSEHGDHYKLELGGSATFLALPYLAEAIEKVPAGKELVVDFERLAYIDHACLELLRGWERRQLALGGKLTVDWTELMTRFESPASH